MFAELAIIPNTHTKTLITWLAVTDTLKMTSYLMFATEFYILKDSSLPLLVTRNIHSVRFLLFHGSNVDVVVVVSMEIVKLGIIGGCPPPYLNSSPILNKSSVESQLASVTVAGLTC
jgi:hypothetical protein